MVAGFRWSQPPSSLGAELVTPRWGAIFERMYRGEVTSTPESSGSRGPGLDGKPWLGVLGNHDYGGENASQSLNHFIYFMFARLQVHLRMAREHLLYLGHWWRQHLGLPKPCLRLRYGALADPCAVLAGGLCSKRMVKVRLSMQMQSLTGLLGPFPAQVKVLYPDFSVDYYFVES